MCLDFLSQETICFLKRDLKDFGFQFGRDIGEGPAMTCSSSEVKICD